MRDLFFYQKGLVVDTAGCVKGNTLSNKDRTLYTVLKHEIELQKLYPRVEGTGTPNWDRWTLSQLESALGKSDYNYFNLQKS